MRLSLSRYCWVAFSLLIASNPAWAMTALKQVQVSGGAEVDLLFDGKISKNQIKTEFFNDIIQVNLRDVSVYPAKISSVSGSSLTKIFAYQYAPRLVRCRLSVKGKAEDYRGRLVIQPNGKTLSIRLIDGKADKVTMTAAQAAQAAQPPKELKVDEAEERALLEKVMKSTPPLANAATPAAEKAAAKAESRSALTSNSGSETLGRAQPLASGKGVPSPITAFLKMLSVLVVFVAVALGLKRAVTGQGSDSKLFGAIHRFAQKSGLGRSAKMIQVVSTHYLGPKKSIAVVRVAGRLLVLGVSSDSINLITQLSGESDLGDAGAMAEFDSPAAAASGSEREPMVPQGTGAMSAGPAIFSELLKMESGKPAAPQSMSNGGGAVRAQIRSRLEGLKPL